MRDVPDVPANSPSQVRSHSFAGGDIQRSCAARMSGPPSIASKVTAIRPVGSKAFVAAKIWGRGGSCCLRDSFLFNNDLFLRPLCDEEKDEGEEEEDCEEEPRVPPILRSFRTLTVELMITSGPSKTESLVKF